MASGNWPGAVAALTKAAGADRDSFDYLTARGVALCLSLQFPEAVQDLDRALRMQPDNWEAKLWPGAAGKTGGDPWKGSMYTTNGPAGSAGQDVARLQYLRDHAGAELLAGGH